MDVVRRDAGRRRWIRRGVWASVGLTAVAWGTVALSRLKPAAMSVDANSVLIDTVKRGPMVLLVRGLGVLTPEEFLWLPAVTDGRVQKILVRPGAAVRPDSVILTLTNPELDVATLEAEFDVKAAEARYRDLEVKLNSDRLALQAEIARFQSESTQAQLKADRDEQLFREELLADLNVRLSKAAAEEWAKRLALEHERLKMQKDATEAQLAVQRADIEKLRALAKLKREQVQALTVRAGTHGVLQELPVQEGQQLAAGSILAKVAQPSKLKAELKIPETQAKDLQLGQAAQIDTRNGIIPGRVVRIDPAAREGTVLVDVALAGPLPPGARPDLSVDGTIEIERLESVLQVGRPAFGQPGGASAVFRLGPDGRGAVRVPVTFGRASVNLVEIRDGLQEGDRVVLSNIPAAEGRDEIQLVR
ncbi:MAG: HlyD family efflux transporter periplasmic adaptor subunit [Bryobacterales bacterium]|nr:HlyD family efflux transporter periplasmic adaptor subunit [Bryobacterales bacterium]